MLLTNMQQTLGKSYHAARRRVFAPRIIRGVGMTCCRMKARRKPPPAVSRSCLSGKTRAPATSRKWTRWWARLSGCKGSGSGKRKQRKGGTRRVPRPARPGRGTEGEKKAAVKNDVSRLTEDDFAEAFHKRFFPYQRELLETKRHRNRFFLKSRQLGFTWFFAQEAFEDACLTGDNQIFLSATRAQAEVFRSYIVALAKEKFSIELKGNPLVLNTAKGQATLYFLSNNSKSAQSYHGHVYIDECFWIQGFNELYKVASGMASHKKWRRTLFSTPSAVAHQAYDLWTGERFQKRFKAKRAAFPSSEELRKGALCPDTFYRKVITLDDAIAGGCDLFDLESLKLEYSADEFRNLFLCEFVDDTQSVFRPADLETCYADTDTWPDFNPTAGRPLGNLPVWGGYDPSRSRDDASFVIVAPRSKRAASTGCRPLQVAGQVLYLAGGTHPGVGRAVQLPAHRGRRHRAGHRGFSSR